MVDNRKRIGYIKTAIAVVLAVVCTANSASALSDISPDPGDMFTIRRDNPVGGGIAHLLKNESGAAYVSKISLRAYFASAPETAPAAPNVEILRGGICKVNDKGAVVVAAGSTLTTVPKKDLCKDKSNGGLYGSYLASAPYYESATSRWVVPITVQFGGLAAGPGGIGPSGQNAFNFRVRVSGWVVGALYNDSAQGFGLRNVDIDDPNYPRAGNFVRQQFGFPCSRGDGSQKIALYDPDIAVFGPTYMWITKNDVPLGPDDYDRNGTGNMFPATGSEVDLPSWAGGRIFVFSSSLGNTTNQSSWLTIKSPEIGKKYKINVYNPYNPGAYAAKSNVLGVSIPNDAIYGDIPCPTYNLIPQVSLTNSDAGYVEQGGTINYSPVIRYSGDMVVPGSEWHMTRVVFGPGDGRYQQFMNGGTQEYFNTNGYAYNTYGGSSPVEIPPGGGVNGNFASDQYLNPGSEPANYPLGTKVCYVLLINRYKQNQPDNWRWRSSTPVCTTVGIKPKVQVLGNDLAATGVIAASEPTLRDGKYYGSWGEFANFSNGNVKNGNYASHSALGGGGMSSKCGVPQWYKLTFANNGACASGMVNDAALGSFGATASNSASLISEIRSRMKPATIASSIADSTFKGGTPSDGSDDVQAVYVAGTANITGDIQPALYPKQNIIIARDGINIAPNVKTVNAWLLVENGTINTCNSGVALYVVNGCRDQLVVNGPVAAKAMKLRRTTEPTAADPGKPAERFNLRADAFVWSYGGGGAANANAVARTVQVKELPPRF